MSERRIGRFRILAEQGRGGMGVVLRGQDESLGRTAAVKLLPPERVKDPRAQARFEREAKAAARLKHDHIAALYEYGQSDDGQPYLAMEWVEGLSLEEKLKEGPLSLELSVKLLGQMLSALDYAHAQGVVHRDIKPANVMLSGEKVTLVDFGLAFIGTEPSLTATGTFLGTPLYIPPEIAVGEDVDGRADLYSAALVFFEMLTGKAAIEATSIGQIIYQQVNGPRPVLSEKVPGLPAGLDEVLLKALARQPADRYPNGQSLLEAVRQACLPAAPPPPPPPRRQPWAGLVAGASLLIFAAFLARPRPDQVASPTPSSRPTPTVSAAAATPSPSPLKATPAKGATPSEDWRADDWRQPGGDSRRAYAMNPITGRLETVWRQKVRDVESVAQGNGVLVVAYQGGLRALNAETGRELWHAKGGGAPIVLGWTDPPYLLLQQSQGWACRRLMDGKPAWEAKLKEPVLGGVLTGQEILYTTLGSTLQALEPTSGEELWKVDAGAPVTSVAPVAGKAGIFLVTRGPLVRAFGATSHRELWHKTPPGRPSCLALAPGGGLLVGCEDGQVVALNAMDGGEVWSEPLSQSSAVVGLAAVSDVVIVTCQDGAVASYDAEEGKEKWKLQLSAAGPALTDGEMVLVATRTGHLVAHDANKGQELWRTPLGVTGLGSPLSVGSWLFLRTAEGVAALRGGAN